MNLKDLLDCTGKLGRFKQGPTAWALRHQKELLNGLKAFIPWSQQLSERRQQLLMETVVDTTAKIFKKVGQKLQLGPTVTIPRPNATAVSAGVIRKTFLAAGRVLKATEALVVDWDKEDEVDMLSEDEEEEEEHDSPPKRKRPPKHVSFSPEPSTKQHSSPATSRRRAKALGRVRRAYRAALRIAKAVEEFPHAFGDEMEWSIRPNACPDIADQVTDDCGIATLDDLEDARDCAPASLEEYIAFLRGSAVIWHAHLCKCPEVNTESLPDPRKENWLEEIPAGKALFREDAGPGAGEKVANNNSIGKQRGVLDAAAKAFNGDYFAADLVQHASGATGNLHVAAGPLQGLNLALPQPVETAQPEYREMFQTHDGRVLTRPPKQYTKEEFGYRLLQFVRGMPDSFEREIHFYHMYVLDLFVKMDSYDVKCVAEYDKYIRQRIASSFILLWNPDMLDATWTRFIQARERRGTNDFEDCGDREAEGPGGGENDFKAEEFDSFLLPVERGEVH
ncbi:hypothetical protein CYMTET_11280 [Cymbomonas tetramitiformis]|uniref:Uncharacterized protein n=1 Tax=Cymbomonas tetramitiformis TaxID=36881 RepID=A0AAE0GML8_9CHLO|nr:hypothetical protein CYMTET_11280 [Cymbomonas tetramitiformis]